jgi:hypothetical protein
MIRIKKTIVRTYDDDSLNDIAYVEDNEPESTITLWVSEGAVGLDVEEVDEVIEALVDARNRLVRE